MSDKNRVIFLELNELCPPLIEKFIQQGHLPNFKKLYESSDTYITDAESDIEHLEPWIQWVTLHTGVSYKEHGIYRLGEADNLTHSNIWDTLSDKGLSSWLCGSMNATWRKDDPNVIAIPDPWSMNASASNKNLQPFYDFVRANVQEHTNEGRRNSLSSTLKFLKFMITNGLSLKTINKLLVAVGKTLLKTDDRWKKATILDSLQFDVFRHIYKKEKPNFSTFFSNSTAHFQHKFWRYMEPEKFAKKPTQKELELYSEAVLYAYKNHDELIGEAFKMADEDTKIIMASALSQQPFTDLDAVGGKQFYRPHDINRIGDIFNLTGIDCINPVMSHQFQIVFNSIESAQQAQRLLDTATLDGNAVFKTKLEDEILFCGCNFHQEVDSTKPISFNDKEITFSDVFYLADSVKSGKHNPKGVFWIQRAKQPSIRDQEIPLTNVCDMLLSEIN